MEHDGPVEAWVQAVHHKLEPACAMVLLWVEVVWGVSCCWAWDPPRLPHWWEETGRG